jgi:hypothetical protein
MLLVLEKLWPKKRSFNLKLHKFPYIPLEVASRKRKAINTNKDNSIMNHFSEEIFISKI